MAAFDARRPTRDVDLAAVDLANDVDDIWAVVNKILAIARDDGLEFDPTTTTAATIRDDDLYGSVRTTVHGSLSKFVVQFHIDVNLGDPLWPAPEEVDVPRLLGGAPIRMRGYRIELILAEKIVTAIQQGTANTRWRDFVDIAALARLDVNDGALVESIRRVAEFRQVPIRPLRDVLSGFPEIGQQRWAGWRRKQGLAATTPAIFGDLVEGAIAFVDPLLQRSAPGQ
jgi:hypothetical protein